MPFQFAPYKNCAYYSWEITAFSSVTMEYQDGKKVEYGDIVYILTKEKYVTVEEDGTTISFQDYSNNGLKQKILVCGNDKLGDKFYLTFKYSRGFLQYTDGVHKSGVDWTERTVYTVDLLKQAIGDHNIQFLRASEN